MKRKSPKAKRQEKYRQDPYSSSLGIWTSTSTATGAWTFDNDLTTTTFTDAGMAIFYDSGIQAGDWIQINGTVWDWDSKQSKTKKVHVARRRKAEKKKELSNDGIYEITDVSPTSITVSAGIGLTTDNSTITFP